MNQITVTTVDGLSGSDRLAIVHRLSWPESEFHQEVDRCLQGLASSSTPIAVWHDQNTLWGWVCSHTWRDMQTMEMFTDERMRGTGIATALAAALSVATLDRESRLAVFSPATESIARRLGFANVVRYEHDWRPTR